MTAGGPIEESRWSGLETEGMREARCSLLIQDEVPYDTKIKALPKQRVLVYQDKGFAATHNSGGKEENFYVDFKGATILQLEPGMVPGLSHKTMPVTITVGGRCLFTPENYQDFRVMMRTKEQSQEMDIAPNGNFDWPDVNSLLCCPLCGHRANVPQPGSRKKHEYWMVFYPLLQITVMTGSQITLGTRTICRLTCLHCMDELLDGLTLTIQPGGSQRAGDRPTRLAFSLPASDVLAEAGSASFLEDGPSRPDTHPHVDDILDAWTLYNLWEHSGAWEALQNDHRLVLSRSMHPDSNTDTEPSTHSQDSTFRNDKALHAPQSPVASVPKLKDRMGQPCGNPSCDKVHGHIDPTMGEICRLAIKCRECLSEHYCSKHCRDISRDIHQADCARKQRDREERREKKAKRVQCETCSKKFPYTKMKKCSRCKSANYCSIECQKADWDRHRDICLTGNKA